MIARAVMARSADHPGLKDDPDLLADVACVALNRLPRLSHPVFSTPGFGRVSEDRFFLCLFTGDPGFDAAEARHLLRPHRPLRVSEVTE